MNKQRLLNLLVLLITSTNHVIAGIGDTTVVQTIRLDSSQRSGYFDFPDDSSKRYEKIIMQYRMRCKNGLVSTTTNRNLGCGEWDYNCYTYVNDSTRIDSIATTANQYTISNSTDTIFPYSVFPIYDYVDVQQYSAQYDSVIYEFLLHPSSGTDTVSTPFSGTSSIQRTQYLWTASELSAAGLIPGPITSLQVKLLSPGMMVDQLRLQMKHTSQLRLDADHPETNGFTQVYFLSTPLTIGTMPFRFYQPFDWDGVSNVLIDVSYSMSTGVALGACKGHHAGFDAAMTSDQEDSYLSFQGNGNFLLPDTSFLDSITNEITIAFWSYGDTLLIPSNTSIAYGTDNVNSRQLNIHLPWSDSNIYWDCGGNGGSYDRISKQALPEDIKGRWAFWTFTKNASTGDMKIFLDGHEWMSGTGKTLPINMKKFWIGVSNNGYRFAGNIDEFSIWNKALDSISIAGIMQHDITPSHPDYTHLQAYYPFNEASGNLANDAGPLGMNATINNPQWRSHDGKNLFRNFSVSNLRPDITFVQGAYVTTVQTIHELDSLIRNPNQIIEYSVVDNSLNIVDTLYAWSANNYSYTYDESGLLLDSAQVLATDTLIQSNLSYFLKRTTNFELIDFITPYGINLNLDGLNGKVWEFDVTDFAPVLRGKKYLAMAGGIYQEENDIRFVFYEGTPVRPVRSIQQIWPNGTWTSASWSQIYNNQLFEPRNVTLDPGASMFKLRSAISGHGQEGEFIARNHTLTVDTVNFTRSVWTECATNPIYPQGGTWIYDRAGWCPGKSVDVAEYELTPFVSPGQQVTFDYSMPYIANPGTSNYRVNNTLISYGSPSFSADATVYTIKSPSANVEFTRFNPICNNPVIVIRNNGADTLRSLDVIYGRAGGVMSNYSWTGNLGFLQKEELVLPAPTWLGSGIDRFQVTVANPNGMNDQYPVNDTMTSDMGIPDTYYGAIVLEYKPNNYLTQNTYTVKDDQGNILLTRTATVGGFVYRDTLNYPTGCYTIYMNDTGDDGLSFWANTNQGTGYFRVRSATTSTLLKTFNPDFGDNINYQFSMNYSLPVDELTAKPIRTTVFPNPSAGRFTLVMDGSRYTAVNVDLLDLSGRTILKEKVWLTQSDQRVDLQADGVAAGAYFLKVSGDGWQETQRLVFQ